jgi:OmpA-OmpF porin, OOP family
MTKFLFFSLSFFAVISMYGQELITTREQKHSLLFSMGGDLQMYRYGNSSLNTNGNGFLFAADYCYNFKPQWAGMAGMAVHTYNSSVTLNYMSATPATDSDGDTYQIRTYFGDWKETQSLVNIEIPFKLQYSHNLQKNLSLLFMGGFSVSFPVSCTYETSSGSIRTTAYYSQWNLELSDLPSLGYYTYSNYQKKSISVNPTFSLVFDVGTLYHPSKNYGVYVGAYSGIILSKLKNTSTNVYSDDIYNGIWNSNLSNKLSIYTIGLRLGIRTFGNF